MMTQQDLVNAFRQLGLQPGDAVLVHSAFSAIGRVEGGPDTVIDALLEVLGKEGTLLMPTLSSGVFDRENSPSKVGLLTEIFRTRKGVLRSFHPSHSVAAYGAKAEKLIEGHLHCPTACGEGTPYAKLMDCGGKVLLLGVDQDRNTSLHGLEAMVRLPYLKTVYREYLDPADGCVKTLEIREYPGPHRNFIGLDRMLREAGVMRLGKVGKAVCRLIDAGGMRDTLLPALQSDPTLILCDNPHCHDCVTQRAAVKRDRLSREDFILSVQTSAIAGGLHAVLEAIQQEGIWHLEIDQIDGRSILDFSESELAALREALDAAGVSVTAVSTRTRLPQPETLVPIAVALKAAAVVCPLDQYTPALGTAAKEANLALHLENHRESSAQCQERLNSIAGLKPGLAFNPAHFARAGEKPFLGIYSKKPLKRWVRHLRFADGTFAGLATPGGYGNGEVKELLSILRCCSFDGPVTITASPSHTFRELANAFWNALNTI